MVFAASCVAAVLGSVHAFSVFLDPLERGFAEARSTVALTYSLALVALTLAVLLGPWLFARGSAALFMLVTCVLAAAGALIAGMAPDVTGIWVGYSLIFGFANGLGYGFALQISAQVRPGHEGLAMGIVTAAYALGAVLAPGLFELALAAGGFRTAMVALAFVLVLTGAFAALLLHAARARYVSGVPGERTPPPLSVEVQGLLWLGYFGGVLAGLMVIGHAAGIAQARSPDIAAWTAPVVIAACNLGGSLLAGRLADRLAPGRVLTALSLTTAIALMALAAWGHPGALLPALGLVGAAYGGTISAYPAAIAKLAGPEASARIYGRVFTAWGTAGLIGPWLAGLLYDQSGGYRLALLLAALSALASGLTLAILFRRVARKRV